ncbi:transporter, major facilitator family protein [Acetobacteraceae bacterium AT-5844]|nr:transporter, major facilitator family protein [Acetobacteraceae bacterium AT-5844]
MSQPATQPAPQPTAPPPPTDVPLARALACIGASVLLWLTQGMGMNLIAVNTPQIQGALGATLNETNWLIAAYMAPNVSLTILLTKVRTHFGLRRFAEISIAIFVAVSALHLVVFDLQSAVMVRFFAGAAASPMSTLAFLYMLEAFPPARKMSWGLSMALACSAAGPIVARLISPVLLDIGHWHGLYILEVGLALMAFCTIYLLPLTPIPRAPVLHWLDFISYPLIATGFGLLAVVFSLGRYYWWFEAPWIGACLAAALAAIGLAAAIELNRHTPLMNIRWLISPEIVHFTLILLAFRIVLAEQTSGAQGLFQALGLLNEQSTGLNLTILACTILGSVTCAMLTRPERVNTLHIVALSLIIAGAWMDGHATSQTRPADMYLSQAMIAFGGALFLPPAMLNGLTMTMRQGPTYMTSFLVVFLFTQSLGGLMGSAFLGSFVILREKFHSSQIVEHITLANPMVAERVHQLSAAYGKVLTDGQLLNAEGLAFLSQQATREANVLAYNDAFLLIAALASLALAFILLHSGYVWLRARLAARQPAPAA